MLVGGVRMVAVVRTVVVPGSVITGAAPLIIVIGIIIVRSIVVSLRGLNVIRIVDGDVGFDADLAGL